MGAQAHEKSDVDTNTAALRAVSAEVVAAMTSRIRCTLVADDAVPPPGSTLVHFIRHGEGEHNAAQREWRARPEWDGKTEPYTIDTDPLAATATLSSTKRVGRRPSSCRRERRRSGQSFSWSRRCGARR